MEEPFSNPVAPAGAPAPKQEDFHPLNNEDFRKLVHTVRSDKPATLGGGTKHGASYVDAKAPAVTDPAAVAAAAKKKKKKAWLSTEKKEELERQRQLERTYRDRAKERREGRQKEYSEAEVTTTADYRAVAPDMKHFIEMKERRKQLIDNSKYLGGDMAHTHLVKGLDYALLEKVKGEITTKEQVLAAPSTGGGVSAVPEEDEQQQVRSRLAKNIIRNVFENKPPQRNELFLPKRMAFLVELEEDLEAADVPTTIIRSLADCPRVETVSSESASALVIHKLAQIFAYLRQGKRAVKKNKGALITPTLAHGAEKLNIKRVEEAPKKEDITIFEDTNADYVPETKRREEKKDEKRDDRRRDDKSSRSSRYFERPVGESDGPPRRAVKASELVEQFHNQQQQEHAVVAEPAHPNADADQKRLKGKLHDKFKIDSYSECYPGMAEMGGGESDEEADFSKMDTGSKRAPVGRWDFENEEEYAKYQGSREAMPKAAFQYGQKMADGRKTRKNQERGGDREKPHKDEKTKLDRDWEKIQKIMSRKSDGGVTRKRPRYDE